MFAICINPKHYKESKIDIKYIDLFLRTVYINKRVNENLQVYFKKESISDTEILKRIEYYENIMKNYRENIQPRV
jgi:hypothetical protein